MRRRCDFERSTVSETVNLYGPRARACEAVKPNRPTNRRCLAAHGSKGLKGSTLYTSGEPCVRSAAVILSCVSRASLISDC
jgi:hypothetical protein